MNRNQQRINVLYWNANGLTDKMLARGKITWREIFTPKSGVKFYANFTPRRKILRQFYAMA